MSYVQNSLVSGESVLFHARFHWIQKVWALILCSILIGIFIIMGMWATEIAVTNRRIIYKRGWLSRKTEEMNLRRMEEINLQQGILGRILGYGKIKINGTGGNVILLPTIASPMRFKQELQEAQARVET